MSVSALKIIVKCMSTYIYDFFGRLGIIENTLKKMFYYTIDQDIFYFILNLKFIFVTYVFVPYFVIFMECFVECERQKLIFKIN